MPLVVEAVILSVEAEAPVVDPSESSTPVVIVTP